MTNSVFEKITPTPPVEVVNVVPSDLSVNQVLNGLTWFALGAIYGPRSIQKASNAVGHPLSKKDARVLFFALKAINRWVKPPIQQQRTTQSYHLFVKQQVEKLRELKESH